MTELTVCIHQPNYLPWLGFFDKIAKSNLFVAFDSVEYSNGRPLTNRNRIRTRAGSTWITVPIRHQFPSLIKDVGIDWEHQETWPEKHLNLIRENYRRAPYVSDVLEILQQTYDHRPSLLADLNLELIERILSMIGIQTRIVRSSTLNAVGAKTELICAICREVGASRYVFGEGGSLEFFDSNVFAKNGIEIMPQRFVHPEYRQQFQDTPFVPRLSVVDAIANEGFEFVKSSLIQSVSDQSKGSATTQSPA